MQIATRIETLVDRFDHALGALDCARADEQDFASLYASLPLGADPEDREELELELAAARTRTGAAERRFWQAKQALDGVMS